MNHSLTSLLIVGLGAAGFGAQRLGAQDRPRAHPVPATTTPTTGGTTPVVTTAFLEPTDTADVTRYIVTAQCMHAILRVADSSLTLQRRDTIGYSLTEPMPPKGIEWARRCLAHYPIATSAPDDLAALLRIAIYAGDDSAVQTVMHRQLALAVAAQASEGEQAMIIDTAIVWLAHNKPANFALAQRLATQLDALGPAGLRERVRLGGIFDLPYIMTGNLDALIESSEALAEAWRRVPPKVLTKFERWILPQQLAAYDQSTHWYRFLKTGSAEEFAQYAAAAAEQLKLASTLGMQPESGLLVGELAPPITGDVWYNTPTPGQPMPVPTPGRLSLIVFVRLDPDGIFDRLAYHGYESVRRVHTRFPTLPITLVTSTSGALVGRVWEPKAEADFLHGWFTDSLKLPFPLSITTGKYTKLANGRLLPQVPPNIEHYKMPINRNGGLYVIVDASGRVVRKGLLLEEGRLEDVAVSGDLELALQHLLERAPAGSAVAK